MRESIKWIFLYVRSKISVLRLSMQPFEMINRCHNSTYCILRMTGTVSHWSHSSTCVVLFPCLESFQHWIISAVNVFPRARFLQQYPINPRAAIRLHVHCIPYCTAVCTAGDHRGAVVMRGQLATLLPTNASQCIWVIKTNATSSAKCKEWIESKHRIRMQTSDARFAGFHGGCRASLRAITAQLSTIATNYTCPHCSSGITIILLMFFGMTLSGTPTMHRQWQTPKSSSILYK